MEFILLILGLALGGGASFFYFQQNENKKVIAEEKRILELQQQKLEVENAIKDKEREAKEILRSAYDEAKELKHEAKTEINDQRIALEKEKTKVEQQELNIEKKDKTLDEKFANIQIQKEQLEEKSIALDDERKKLEEALNTQEEKLAEIAKLSVEEAKEQLLEQVEQNTKDVLLKQMNKAEIEIKENSEKISRNIVCNAIQRYAAEVATETMLSKVDLPSDELKGRIIGREGRNINAIEQATGVDVIIDDTPNTILISGFDLVRREVCKRLITQLVEDGRIHPSRIEELADKARNEVNAEMKKHAEAALMELGISGIAPELIMILGKLYYRTSYGQNQLKHAVEVAYTCSSIAAQVGVDQKQAKMAGLFHDIGKAVDHEIDGGHAVIGYDILKKYGINEEVAYAVGSHHEDMPITTPLGFIVCAADAISGARPGARRENFEAYIERLKALESIAMGYKGVTQAFAIQAGREVRVMINPSEVDDFEAKKLALKIAEDIEKQMTYPGQIKVQVIRETREVEFAK